MKLRIVKIESLDSSGICLHPYKVQRRWFFMWFDCKDKLKSTFTPWFSRYQSAETFGLMYAQERNKKAVFL